MHGAPNRSQTAKLAARDDIVVGSVVISPALRSISGPDGRATLEPQMMQVLLSLAERPGALVTREQLLERCWGSTVVGDDSLNRAIAGIRRAARKAVGKALEIETVAGAGYSLIVQPRPIETAAAHRAESVEQAMAEGWRSWRLGLPQPDTVTIERLRTAVAQAPHRADAWAMLALVLRHAAEHGDGCNRARDVEDCQAASEQALAIEPGEATARTALVSLAPLFGDWLPRRRQLLAILEDAPTNFPAIHDMAILEMATGRPSAAVPMIEKLLEQEPLAAILHYKRVYHLWTLGRLGEMDQVGDRAMQLWPRHPAIWMARFWSLAFTDRPHHAREQLLDGAVRPNMPETALRLLRQTVDSLIHPDDSEARRVAIGANLAAASQGPAQSAAAIIHLSGLGAVEEAFEVAEGYLCRSGPIAVGVHKTQSDPSITDQHRRVTQLLFIPVTQSLRASNRFEGLCHSIGLGSYWEAEALTPDWRRDL